MLTVTLLESTAQAARRLGRPHFMYLRAVVEGLAAASAAARYLGADGPTESRDAHHQVAAALRSIALRRGNDLWARLEGGVALRRARAPRPSLDAWAESAGIDPAEWGEAELLEMYYEAHPPDPEAMQDAATSTQLRRTRLELLRELEATEGEAALPEHAVDGWFDELTAIRLRGAGIERLGELQARILRGGRWFAGVDAIGPTKAAAIEGYLAELLPAPPASIAFPPTLQVPPLVELEPAAPVDVDQAAAAPAAFVVLSAIEPTSTTAIAAAGFAPQVDPLHARIAQDVLPPKMRAQLASAGLAGQEGRNRCRPSGLAARDDVDAAAAWLCARAGAPGEPGHVATTFSSYRQQVRRLLLWCTGTRRVAISSMTSADCAAYMAFLSDIPAEWISAARAEAWSPLWRPFADQLAPSSREQAIRQVSGMFEWLVVNQYLQTNPWRALKLRQPDDPARRPRESRAFTPEAWAALLAYLEHPDMNPTGDGLRSRQRRAERDRMKFVLDFNEPCGLRAREFVLASTANLAHDGQAWSLHVHGKGARNRDLELPPQAVRALETYLASRGFPSIDAAPNGAFVLVQLMSEAPLKYAAFYEAFRDFVRDAIEASNLQPRAKEIAKQASTHWLRHTTAVRLDERGADPVVIKDHLGHAHIDTTMNYLKSQGRRRRAQVHKAFS